MSNWLLQKGISVKNCNLMTTSSEAPFLSYKVTIDKKDFDRATQDASLWPYGVGVRLFVDFKRDTGARPNNEAYRNDRIERNSYRKQTSWW